MAKSVVIDHYEPKAVMRGLLDGDDFSNRVAGTCIYTVSALRAPDTFSLAKLLPRGWTLPNASPSSPNTR